MLFVIDSVKDYNIHAVVLVDYLFAVEMDIELLVEHILERDRWAFKMIEAEVYYLDSSDIVVVLGMYVAYCGCNL